MILEKEKKRPNEKESGQVAVEYLMIIFVIISIMMAILPLVKNYLSPANIDCEREAKSIVCLSKKIFSNDFKYFLLMR